MTSKTVKMLLADLGVIAPLPARLQRESVPRGTVQEDEVPARLPRPVRRTRPRTPVLDEFAHAGPRPHAGRGPPRTSERFTSRTATRPKILDRHPAPWINSRSGVPGVEQQGSGVRLLRRRGRSPRDRAVASDRDRASVGDGAGVREPVDAHGLRELLRLRPGGASGDGRARHARPTRRMVQDPWSRCAPDRPLTTQMRGLIRSTTLATP